MQDFNVQQPNYMNRGSGNETIIEEETGEDESMLRMSRFSKKLDEDENIDLLANAQNRPSQNLKAN